MIVVINGYPGSGKDTFVQFCKQMAPAQVGNVSTVDRVKELAMRLGWDGTKTSNNRKFLSGLKKLLGEWDDIPVQSVIAAYHAFIDERCIYPEDALVMFVHVREPEEITRFVADYDAKTLFIARDSVEGTYSNNSDNNVRDFAYDYLVANNGTLDDLKQSAETFLHELGIIDI